LAKAKEAGVPILGGHTIQSIEPIYGLMVHGVVHPKKIVRNRGAKAGDRLLLTKPLGTGTIIAGIRRDLVSDKDIEAACTVMLELNRRAAEVMLRHHVHAATDVTGFGFLGHLKEIVEASKVTVQVAVDRFQFLPGARELAEKKIFPQATFANAEH